MKEEIHNKKRDNSKTSKKINRKIILSILIISFGVLLISGIWANGNGNDDPTAGFNIHVSVGRHDHANLDAQFDHYCKLTPPIVATCLLFAEGKSGDTILSEVEYIITKDQYLQLPFRDRPNWHNHAVELTPERGMPDCVSLPEGLECGALVSILQETYGKVINLWDPSDHLPSYPPYHFIVDSPFALEQDLNNNLHNICPVGDSSTSSVGILNEVPEDNGNGNGDENESECDPAEDLEIDYRTEDTGIIVQLDSHLNFDEAIIDYFSGNIKVWDHSISGRGRIRAHATTDDDKDLRLYVTRFEATDIIEHDCESITWRNTGTGRLREIGKSSRRIDFTMDVTYDLLTGKIDAIAMEENVNIFEFEDMIDENFD